MIKTKILNNINYYFQFIKKGKGYDITIIDDVFPYPVSPWRNMEYIAIANQFNTLVYSDGIETNNCIYNPYRKTFNDYLNEFNKIFPNNKVDCKKLRLFSPLNTKLIYLLFFNYLNHYFKHVKKNNLNLAFTLYPGGGFDTYSSFVKKQLMNYTHYKKFKGLIVNQQYARQYLINEVKVPMEKVFLIKELVTIDLYKGYNPLLYKKWFGIDKRTLDIAFVANKYTHNGADKGFDTFQQIAEVLISKYDFVKFHIVGGFNEKDVINKHNLKNYNFYSFQNFTFFKEFYKSVDVFLSPNKPFVNGGNFDGFPLGTAVDAGMLGAVVMMTDFLKENVCYEHNHDFFNINGGVDETISYIEYLINRPEYFSFYLKNFIKKTWDYNKNNIALSKRIDFFKKMLDE